MSGEIDEEGGQDYYTHFYADGGWEYSFRREYRWHRKHLVKRFRLRRGMRMLEVACGCGFHTNLFNRMGFDCTGVDRSRAGIDWAQAHYPKHKYHCCDVLDMPFEQHAFDAVIARGCSHYHYDLTDPIALETTRTLLRYLESGGVFVMIVVTDRSGRRDPDKIWQNKEEDYRRHFSSFGLEWSVDWVKGMAICGLRNQVARTRAPLPQTVETAAATG